MKDKVLHFAQTDVGVKRSHNQDSYGVGMAKSDDAWRRRGHLFVVADGMGAHAVGELASKLAVDTIQHTYPRLRHDEPSECLREAITTANQTINEKGEQNPEFKGMGTTTTTLAITAEGAFVGHVGDSRCYRIRKHGIEQLTYDHSLQWELARRQHVPPEDLAHIPANVIIRSLGPQPQVEVDATGPYPVEEGDRFLLCSDGLSGPVSDFELWAVTTHLPPRQACQFLVDLANLRGGLDNITILLVQVGDPERAGNGRALAPLLSTKMRRAVAKIPPAWWWLAAGLGAFAVGMLLPAQAYYLVLFVSVALMFMALRAFGQKPVKKTSDDDDAPPPEGPTPIYRAKSCAMDRNILERFANAEQHLRELALEQNWKIDVEKMNELRGAAEQQVQAGKLGDALGAYCAGISLLSAGLRKHQGKQEILIPQWDRYSE